MAAVKAAVVAGVAAAVPVDMGAPICSMCWALHHCSARRDRAWSMDVPSGQTLARVCVFINHRNCTTNPRCFAILSSVESNVGCDPGVEFRPEMTVASILNALMTVSARTDGFADLASRRGLARKAGMAIREHVVNSADSLSLVVSGFHSMLSKSSVFWQCVNVSQMGALIRVVRCWKAGDGIRTAVALASAPHRPQTSLVPGMNADPLS